MEILLKDFCGGNGVKDIGVGIWWRIFVGDGGGFW